MDEELVLKIANIIAQDHPDCGGVAPCVRPHDKCDCVRAAQKIAALLEAETKMSEDMIERVENVIARYVGSASLANDEAQQAALEVVAAMREPTEAMREHFYAWRLQRVEDAKPAGPVITPLDDWETWIDAALKSHAKPA